MTNDNDDLELILRFLDDDLTPAELERLNQRLLAEPELRRQLIEQEAFDDALADHFISVIDDDENSWKWIRQIILSAFLTLPPLAMSGLSAFGGDYSMALDGWRDTVLRQIPIVVSVLLLLFCCIWIANQNWSLIRARWLAGLGGLASLLVSSVACYVAVSSYVDHELIRREDMVQRQQWISLDSPHFWPADQVENTGRPAQEPTPEELQREFEVLVSGGFTGLLLHECRDPQVPKLAKSAGFQVVFQGIRVVDPQNFDHPETQRQIENAIASRDYVDGYILGELAAREVDLLGLRSELSRLRWKTGKLVTTSFLHGDLVGPRGKPLLELQDFTIRSLARPWIDNSGDPELAAAKVEEALESFSNDTRPGLLTTVFYPSGGGEGFTPENQYRFFSRVTSLMPQRGVALCYFSAFDRPWAQKLAETTDYTPAFEGHTGLIAVEEQADGALKFTPKPAFALFAP